MKKLEKYMTLVTERPYLFTKEGLEVILDKNLIETFERETGKEIGIVYESDWRLMVVDLVRNTAGKLFAYERVIPTKLGGVAVLPVYQDSIILIKEYRHPVNKWCWEIPRGFGTAGTSAMENAHKELLEETGIKNAKFEYLGALNTDSGLTSDQADLFLAEIEDLDLTLANKEETETIVKVKLFPLSEVREMVAKSKITDSFTLSALGIWQLRKDV